ncbi:glycosyltransferase [Pantoea sp. CS_6]|uniref:glycosyltransferase family 2 protein n=1 Tax=Pantoea sp. CS_6 TaxID=3055795 RepID=UPI0035C05CE0
MSQHRDWLLSIIIPLYNSQQYIHSCLTSLFIQAGEDIQVIIIDDGSTDDSALRVKELLSTNPPCSVEFIQQTNQGVSAARNAGLQEAKGKFITFLDADDLLSRNYLSIIRPLLLADVDDLIDFNYARFEHSIPEATDDELPQRIAYDFSGQGLNCLNSLFTRSMWHLWNRIYRRTLLEGERFEVGRRYEDVMFTPFQYLKTQKIAHIENTLYYYRDNNHSITRNVRKSDIQDMLFAMNKMCTMAQSNNELRDLAAGMIVNCFNEVKSMSKKVYGFYHYDNQTKHAIKSAARICKGSCKTKKYMQMRYPEVDTFFSWLRYKSQ